MPSSSFLQAIIKKIARLQERLINQIDILNSSFDGDTCPPQEEVLRVISKRNALAGGISQIQNQFVTLSRTANTIEGVVTALQVPINIIKVLPLPTALPGVTTGVVVTVGDILRLIQENLTKFKSIAGGVEFIVQYGNTILSQLSTKLNELDTNIQQCAESLGIEYEIINNELNSSGENVLSNTELTYRGFTFDILYDKLNETPYPKRYAVARNASGVILLRSESSFASDPNVLIEELKFQIDIQNLKAN